MTKTKTKMKKGCLLNLIIDIVFLDFHIILKRPSKQSFQNVINKV